jgi:hypothetical protein
MGGQGKLYTSPASYERFSKFEKNEVIEVIFAALTGDF